MIRIELMIAGAPRRADFTWVLAALSAAAVLAIGLAAYRLPIYFAEVAASAV